MYKKIYNIMFISYSYHIPFSQHTSSTDSQIIQNCAPGSFKTTPGLIQNCPPGSFKLEIQTSSPGSSWQRPRIVLAVSHHRPGSVPASSWQRPRIALAVSRHRPGSVPASSWQRPGSVPASSWQRLRIVLGLTLAIPS